MDISDNMLRLMMIRYADFSDMSLEGFISLIISMDRMSGEHQLFQSYTRFVLLLDRSQDVVINERAGSYIHISNGRFQQCSVVAYRLFFRSKMVSLCY